MFVLDAEGQCIPVFRVGKQVWVMLQRWSRESGEEGAGLFATPAPAVVQAEFWGNICDIR